MDYKLRRYNFGVDFGNQFHFAEADGGRWVAWEDVEPLLQAYLSLNNLINENESLKNEINKLYREKLNNTGE